MHRGVWQDNIPVLFPSPLDWHLLFLKILVDYHVLHDVGTFLSAKHFQIVKKILLGAAGAAAGGATAAAVGAGLIF